MRMMLTLHRSYGTVFFGKSSFVAQFERSCRKSEENHELSRFTIDVSSHCATTTNFFNPRLKTRQLPRDFLIFRLYWIYWKTRYLFTRNRKLARVLKLLVFQIGRIKRWQFFFTSYWVSRSDVAIIAFIKTLPTVSLLSQLRRHQSNSKVAKSSDDGIYFPQVLSSLENFRTVSHDWHELRTTTTEDVNLIQRFEKLLTQNAKVSPEKDTKN